MRGEESAANIMSRWALNPTSILLFSRAIHGASLCFLAHIHPPALLSWQTNDGTPRVHPRHRQKEVARGINGKSHYKAVRKTGKYLDAQITSKPNHNPFTVRNMGAAKSTPTTGFNTATMVSPLSRSCSAPCLSFSSPRSPHNRKVLPAYQRDSLAGGHSKVLRGRGAFC
jgi:hypothetical protein